MSRLVTGFFAALLFGSACTMPYTHETFYTEIMSFQKAAIQEGLGIEVATILQHTYVNLVDNLPGRAIGVCSPFSDTPMVFVLRSYWEKADAIHREALIWHELGHCVLHNAHNERTKPDGHPISLMYPSIQTVDNEEYYKTHRAEYRHELFHNKNKF